MFRYALVFGVMVLSCATRLPAAPARLVIDAELSPAVRHAVDELSAALKQQGIVVTRDKNVDGDALANLVVGLVGASPAADRLIHEHKLAVGEAPESLLIKTLSDEKPTTILLAGRDERGLAYAVLEAAEAIRLAPRGSDVLTAVHDAVESPHLRMRSVSIHLFNADLERPWYFSEDFWHGYFSMLAKDRYNNFILTFADQTNYLAPPFPWLFESPEYPEVQVEGLSREDRDRNFQMLRRISELATEHGLDFTLSIWQQQPVQKQDVGVGPTTHNYGPTLLKNLPSGERLIDYNTTSLGRLLKECPAIRGLQLRLNDESGIPEDRQKDYYDKLFAAVHNCGHAVRIDLRYKGLRQETIDQAVKADLDVTVSTKFWCEHMGLPFHPTTQDQRYSANRYGYGTLLQKPHNYRVSYQLWNAGSSRILLWGDPTYAARFAESCRLGDGEGFEIFAPLTNKGWGNEPGDWRIFADRSLEHYQWEYERYWLYYLAFGRMGYNPGTAAEVWQRELRSRFGPAATEVENAYRNASQALPLLTAVCLFSASEWRFWPEMDTGGPLEAYCVIQPSDYGQFYAIRPWQALEGFPGEKWLSNHRGFVDDAITGDIEAKWTPFQVSQKLDQLAGSTLAAIESAHSNVADSRAAEFRSTELDMRVLAQLARYHAAKKRAATHLTFFHATGEVGRLSKAFEYIQQAAAAWETLVQLTDGVYHDKLVFGKSSIQTGTPERRVDTHACHWKDRLPEVRADVKYVADLVAKHGSKDQPYREYPGEKPLHERPHIHHTPVSSAKPNNDLPIGAQIESAVPLRQVLLHYRTLDQTQAWRHEPMTASADGSFQAVIPGEEITSRYDMQYYLEARVDGGGTLWPNWEEETPYVVVSVDDN